MAQFRGLGNGARLFQNDAMPTFVRKAILFAGAMLGSLILGLLVWEIALRAGDTPPYLNAWGFHDVEPDSTREVDRRVLLVGDSFVEGEAVPVAETVGRRFEHLLRRSTTADVIALGAPGAGQATELELIETYLPRVRPNAVVLAFLPANDVMNNSPELEPKRDKPFYRLVDGELVRVAPTVTEKRQATGLRVWDQWTRGRDRAGQKAQLVAAGGGVPLPFFVYAKQPSVEWEAAWQVTFALVARLRERCNAAGAALLVAVVAERMQTDPEQWQRTLAAYPAMRDGAWDVRQPARRMVEWCRANGVAQVDFYEAFAAGAPEKLYLPDGHWSAAGHKLAAQVLAAAVTDSAKPNP
jgi:GDSL-like Lipase/Acylhydrolase family